MSIFPWLKTCSNQCTYFLVLDNKEWKWFKRNDIKQDIYTICCGFIDPYKLPISVYIHPKYQGRIFSWKNLPKDNISYNIGYKVNECTWSFAFLHTKQQRFPIIIDSGRDYLYHIQILGISEIKECLSMYITLHQQTYIIESTISAISRDKDLSGTQILQFVEQINHFYHVKTCQLCDVSNYHLFDDMECSTIILNLLLGHDPSFYSKFGFQPCIAPSNEIMIPIIYRKIREKIKGITVADILQYPSNYHSFLQEYRSKPNISIIKISNELYKKWQGKKDETSSQQLYDLYCWFINSRYWKKDIEPLMNRSFYFSNMMKYYI